MVFMCMGKVPFCMYVHIASTFLIVCYDVTRMITPIPTKSNKPACGLFRDSPDHLNGFRSPWPALMNVRYYKSICGNRQVLAIDCQASDMFSTTEQELAVLSNV